MQKVEQNKFMPSEKEYQEIKPVKKEEREKEI